MLDVGDVHRLHVEQVGHPRGAPVLYLHGGPGSGCTRGARTYFDEDRHRAILFDQRAAGRSTPHASAYVDWTSIDLEHHIADIEHLRATLGIDRWAVFGVSWGSVLAIAYAQRHPERVRGVLAAAVSTGTREDIEWLTVGAGRFFPAEWEEFMRFVPADMRDLPVVEAYHRLVMDPDPFVHEPAAQAWCAWEDRHMATTPGTAHNPRYDDPRFRLGFARQVTHAWVNGCWLGDDELVAGARDLEGIPCWIVHGRLDLSGPLRGPWRLHRAWPGSELVVIEGEGHGGPQMQAACRRILHAI